MITPRFLSAASDQMMRLFAELETNIKADMCRRMAKLGNVTDATEWQAKILKEIGGLTTDINKQLAKYDKATQKQVQELFESLVEKNVPAEISDNQKQMMAATAGYQSLITDLSNLTRTSTATTEFISVANAMYMKVASGAFSYNQAIKDAVDEMASKGLTTLQYGNQAHSIESIARTCVITTLGQTAASQSIQNAQDTDTDLVMVSAHEGARHTDKPANPWSNHDEWQGKIYCLNGERDWTDSEGNVHHALNFHDACGYGEVDGICGINCRHTFYPFYEGENPRYEDTELQEYREKNLELDGKKVSRYEAEQAMRKCERQIRTFKRKADCQAAAGLDNTAARVKIGQWQAARRAISEQTGIPADYAREYIGTAKGQQPRGSKPSANPWSASVGMTQITGGSYGGILDKSTEEQIAYAKRAYEEIRNKNEESDVAKVSKSSGLSKEDVLKIRNHLFFEKHHLEKGFVRFDESPQIAQAWEALEQNRATELDIILLRHELEELTLMKEKGYTFEKAHLFANKKYPWEYKIKYDWSDDKIQETIDKLINLL